MSAVVVSLLAGGTAAFVTLRHLDRQYGPLEQGSFGGPASLHDWVTGNDGFSLRLLPRPNASGRLVGTVENAGAHSVKITAIEHGDLVSDIRWARLPSDGVTSLPDLAVRWRRFPATVPARSTVQLLITVHHPANCSAYTKRDDPVRPRYGGYHRVHWESLLHDHVSEMRIYGSDLADDVFVC